MRAFLPMALVEGVDDWVWLAIGAGAFLLLVLAIVLTVRARRLTRAAEAPAAPDWRTAAAAPAEHAVSEESAAWPEPIPEATAPSEIRAAATAAASDLHYCRCPSCQTQFTVNGAKPLVTNCPGCGKKGFLR